MLFLLWCFHALFTYYSSLQKKTMAVLVPKSILYWSGKVIINIICDVRQGLAKHLLAVR